MAANIVVVHDDSDFLDRTTTVLQAAGYDAAFFYRHDGCDRCFESDASDRDPDYPCFAIPARPITGLCAGAHFAGEVPLASNRSSAPRTTSNIVVAIGRLAD
jgi:hypothetical protein